MDKYKAHPQVCIQGSCFQSIPSGWNPDTTLHSNYSFVNADGEFIQNCYLLRLYDASHHLGAYAVHDTLYDQRKIVTALFNELMKRDPALGMRLLKRDIQRPGYDGQDTAPADYVYSRY